MSKLYSTSARPSGGTTHYPATVWGYLAHDFSEVARAYRIESLNDSNAFKGEIECRENIGKSGDDLVALWNAEHPDDLVA